MIRVGDKVRVYWFTGSTPPNLATVLAVEPYRGAYPQFFDVVLTLTAPTTKRGSTQMTYNSRDGGIR